MWNTRSVDGVHRFLARVFRMCTGELSREAPSREQLRLLHATIKRVCCAGYYSSLLSFYYCQYRLFNAYVRLAC